jgi:uncharacterized OsmC-like protein
MDQAAMMDARPAKLTFNVTARRLSERVSVAMCKAATIDLDTDLAGSPNAFNPAELLLAALAACMIKGIERVAPMLKFQLRSVTVSGSWRPAGRSAADGIHRIRARRRFRRVGRTARTASYERAEVRHGIQHGGPGDEAAR